jgi:hypothetical protein
MREAFTKEFSNEVMMKPGRRFTEADWQKLLIRFRSGIIRCPHCGDENLGGNGDGICGKCKQPLPDHLNLVMDGCDYKMPILPNNVVYRSQFGTADVDQAGNPVLLVRPHPNDPSILLLQNVSGTDVECITPSGKRKVIPHAGAMPANVGIKVRAFNGTVEITQ